MAKIPKNTVTELLKPFSKRPTISLTHPFVPSPVQYWNFRREFQTFFSGGQNWRSKRNVYLLKLRVIIICTSHLIKRIIIFFDTNQQSSAVTVPSKCPAFSCQLQYWFLHIHTPPFVVPLDPVRFQLEATSSGISSQFARPPKLVLVFQDKTGLPCSTCQSCPWRHPVSVAPLQWQTDLHSFQADHLNCPQGSDRLDGAPQCPLVRTVAGTVQGKEKKRFNTLLLSHFISYFNRHAKHVTPATIRLLPEF